MAAYSLLVLDLRSALPYEGIENPPLSGAPLQGKLLAPLAEGGVAELPIGAALEEGAEELFLFDEAELVRFDPDEGPRIAAALPRPGFYGRGLGRGAPARECSTGSGDADPADAAGGAVRRELPRGKYAFMQWRPADEADLRQGLEWFARETWWEGTATEGPYILRRLREDGKLATQVLRRVKA